MGKKYERNIPKDPGLIIKDLGAIQKNEYQPVKTRQETVRILREDFSALACVIVLLDPSKRNSMVVYSICGDLPIPIECEVNNGEKDTLIERFLVKSRSFLALAEIRGFRENVSGTIDIGDKNLIGVLGTIIKYKDRIPCMILIAKKVKPCMKDLEAFSRIRPHLAILIGPGLLSENL